MGSRERCGGDKGTFTSGGATKGQPTGSPDGGSARDDRNRSRARPRQHDDAFVVDASDAGAPRAFVPGAVTRARRHGDVRGVRVVLGRDRLAGDRRGGASVDRVARRRRRARLARAVVVSAGAASTPPPSSRLPARATSRRHRLGSRRGVPRATPRPPRRARDRAPRPRSRALARASVAGASSPPAPERDDDDAESPPSFVVRLASAATGWLASNYFLVGMLSSVALASLCPGLGATGGPLQPEITVNVIAVRLMFLISGFNLPTSELRASVANVRANALIQSFVFGVAGFVVAFAVKPALIAHFAFDPRLANGLVVLACLPTTIGERRRADQRRGRKRRRRALPRRLFEPRRRRPLPRAHLRVPRGGARGGPRDRPPSRPEPRSRSSGLRFWCRS